jgi:hypothetical protein
MGGPTEISITPTEGGYIDGLHLAVLRETGNSEITIGLSLGGLVEVRASSENSLSDTASTAIPDLIPGIPE